MAIRCINLKPMFRFLSCNYRQISSCTSELLQNRTVLTIERASCSEFLQGLITNDMDLLSSQKSLYTMLLNSKGRVLFDAIVYKTESPDKFHLECCSDVADAVSKHLRVYSLRKKIAVSKSSLSVWAVFCDSGVDKDFIPDPRCIDPWVFRCLSESPPSRDVKNGIYTKLRISLGIAEGSKEIPVGEAFPLEYNADFLNGVSFDKGCYVGQELTARVHHTGVVRKRIMPLELPEEPSEDCDLSKPVIDVESSKAVGKIRGLCENRAVALMRVKETISSKGLCWGNLNLKANIPVWWPLLMTESLVQ
uniref:Putative transferase CAF17, mitochondrial n=1 Tax=Lygus hesperus TaxID=30085 RepID=A0A0K8SQI9_LYGHE